MNHLSEDTIYKFKLELLDPTETENARRHLEHCEKCGEKSRQINDQLSLLSDFDPEIQIIDNPLLKQKPNYTIWLKRAAVFLIFLFIGYSVSNQFNNDEIIVVGQTFLPQNMRIDTLNYVDCPNIDIFNEM